MRGGMAGIQNYGRLIEMGTFVVLLKLNKMLMRFEEECLGQFLRKSADRFRSYSNFFQKNPTKFEKKTNFTLDRIYFLIKKEIQTLHPANSSSFHEHKSRENRCYECTIQMHHRFKFTSERAYLTLTDATAQKYFCCINSN